MSKKTALEHFNDIRELDVADGPGITVEDILPGKCAKVWKSLIQVEQDKKKAACWEIAVKKNVDMLLIKKYDNVSDYNSAVWLQGRDKLTDDEFKILKGVK